MTSPTPTLTDEQIAEAAFKRGIAFGRSLAANEAAPAAQMTQDEIHAHDWWCPHCLKSVPPEMVTYDETHYLEGGGCGRPVRGERIEEAAPAAAAEGLVLVPLKPTDAVLTRLCDGGLDNLGDEDRERALRKARARYAAVVSASPSVEEVGSEANTTVPVNRPATAMEAQHAAQIGACLPNGVLFDYLGNPRKKFTRVTLDGSHLIVDDAGLKAFKTTETDDPSAYTYTDTYLSQEEFDGLPEFDGF